MYGSAGGDTIDVDVESSTHYSAAIIPVDDDNEISIQDDEQQKRKQRKIAVVLFAITTVLLFADQNLMSPNLTAIAKDFGFNDEERDRKLGGDISLAFFLLGAPASFLVGILADTRNRSYVFGITVLIGEGACFFSYWTTTYTSLYVTRAITGFAVGGAFPVIFSILGDMFTAENRHLVSAIVSFGVGAGISVGQAIAGYVGPTYGWRLPFVLVSAPAILCAMLVILFVQDPERGQMEEATLAKKATRGAEEGDGEMTTRENDDNTATLHSPPPAQLFQRRQSYTKMETDNSDDSHTNNNNNDINNNDSDSIVINNNTKSNLSSGGKFHNFFKKYCIDNIITYVQTTCKLLSTPTLLLAVLQGAPGCVTWGIFNVFLNDYLSENRGFTIEAATSILMCFGIGNAIGLIIGGSLGSYLYRKNKRYPALLAGFSSILSVVPLYILLNYVRHDTTPLWVVAFVSISAGIGSGPTGPIIKATVTNVSTPQTRGQAFALFALTDDFGKGLGPYFVSLLIVTMGGRQAAFNVGLLGWILCGILNLLIYFTVEKDETKIQREVAFDQMDE